ncbi:MAG TPA: YfhO family protein [Thermoanaerobaculia bacterium]|nr:YfhO family protein [Thermoanaerobaculia bacterium]
MFNPTWLFVAAVYAGAVWLARRAQVGIPLRVALFFYALVFVFFYLPLTQDYVNVPMDFLQTLPPWAHRFRYPWRPANGWMNDIVLQIMPWADQVRDSWRSLTPPLWNHLSASGYPLLANPQSAAFSPLRILTLPLSLGHAMTAEAAMKVLIALTFTYLFCRRRGYSELASTFGAVAFGFSMFLIVWLHFPLATSACLVPAVLYAVDLLLERVTYARFVTLAVAWTVLLFGGHPETAAHTFFLVFLYAVWSAATRRRADGTSALLHFFAAFFGAMAVAGLLSAPLLGPFAEALQKSKRYQELTAVPNSAVVPFSDWQSAIALLQPHFFGEVPEEKPWGPAHPESITAFAGFLGVAAWFALLANVIATRAWRSREAFFVAATLLVVGIIMSWPGVYEAFHFVFRLAANARLRLILALLLAIQTAALIDLIERGKRVAVLSGIAAASALLLFVLYSTHFANAFRYDTAVLAILPSVVVLAVATLAASVRRHDVALLAVLVALVAELWIAGRDWNPVVDGKWMYPRTPILEKMDELHAKAPPGAPFRIAGAGPAFFPNLSAIYGYEDIRPHDPMANGRYIGILRNVAKYDPSEYFARWNDLDTPFLDYLNVRYVMTSWRGALPPKFRLVYDGNDGRIYENTAVLPRFYPVRNVIIDFNDDTFYRRLRTMDDWPLTAVLEKLELENQQQHDDFFHPRPANAPIATSEIIEAKPTSYRLHVRSPRYSLIVSSIPWWPGWKVSRNGAEVDPIQVNGGFLGFAVPEGELEVRVWYEPWTYRWGAIIAGLTVVALIVIGKRIKNFE